ncbi:MAG: hypothetical protein OEM46_08680 [Ignavibacteria bacterium]|nr:hypothetical protein [Ignavibacteria bacterium]
MKSLTIESGAFITFSVGIATVDDGAANNSGNIIFKGGSLEIKNTSTGSLTNSSSLTISSGQLKVGVTVTNISMC